MTAPADGSMLDAYIALYENLSEADLDRLETLVTPDVRFKDPFNDLRGVEPLRKLLVKTLEDVADPRFEVEGVWRREADATVVLMWRFSGRVPVLNKWEVRGLSHIGFAPDGRIASHVDYWDAAEGFYARLPVLGAIVRRVGRRLSIG